MENQQTNQAPRWIPPAGTTGWHPGPSGAGVSRVQATARAASDEMRRMEQRIGELTLEIERLRRAQIAAPEAPQGPWEPRMSQA